MTHLHFHKLCSWTINIYPITINQYLWSPYLSYTCETIKSANTVHLDLWPAYLSSFIHLWTCQISQYLWTTYYSWICWWTDTLISQYLWPKQWHQLALIISWLEHLNNNRITRAYRNANCHTDPLLSAQKKMSRCVPRNFIVLYKQNVKSCINTATTAIPKKVSLFRDILSAILEDYQELYIEMIHETIN